MDKYFFNNIFILTRRRLGLSQIEFGKKLGVSHQSISHIENKNSCPSMENISKLCETFNLVVKVEVNR